MTNTCLRFLREGDKIDKLTSLARAGETRWGSHYKNLLCNESIWDVVIGVLLIMQGEPLNPSKAGGYVRIMESSCFVIIMKMMLKVSYITNELSRVLPKNDHNILQAMALIVDVN
jgi:hypothetical protein